MELVMIGTVGKSLRIDIRSDKGAYVGMLAPDAWDLLSPVLMTCAEFDQYRRRFTGLCEASKTFPASTVAMVGGMNAEEELIIRVKKMLNVYVVQGAGGGELLFAGSKKEMIKEEKVLMAIRWSRYVYKIAISSFTTSLEAFLTLTLSFST